MRPQVRTRLGSLRAVVLGAAQRELWPEPGHMARVRASGGGAVLSGPWLLRAAVLLPREHPLVQDGPAATVHWLGEVHRRWLRAQGVAAEVYAGGERRHWASFAERAPGELVLGERKIVGIGQAWRRDHLLLSSGVLLAAPPWPLLCAVLRRPLDQAALLAATTVSAAECLGRAVDAAAWADGLRHALRLALAAAAPAAMPAAPAAGRAARVAGFSACLPRACLAAPPGP